MNGRMAEERKGMLLVVSGPAGAGKGTLIERLMQSDPTFVFSVSCTTREMRYYETNGVQYYFINDEQFDKYIQENAFLEYATVHGHRYGTLLSEVKERHAKGINVILDIDVQGGLAVMKKAPDCVSVFIYPASYQDLLDHLHKRNSEGEEEIQRRVHNARGEIQKMGEYQYLLLNDDLETAFDHLKCIVTAEKMKSSRFIPTIPEKRPDHSKN